MKQQLEFEEQLNNDQLSYIYYTSKIDDAKNKFDYRMTSKLYNEIVSCNNPKVYLSLFTSAPAFNRSYDGHYKHEENISRIDMLAIFKKLLISKDIILISIALNTLNSEIIYGITNDELELQLIYDKCILMLLDFIEENPDEKFLCEIINQVVYNWNKKIEFLLNYYKTNGISNKLLWNKIIKYKLLSHENISLLLEDNLLLKIMYLMKCNYSFSKKHRKILGTYFEFNKIKREIEDIDKYFYMARIMPLITNLMDENFTKKEILPISFTEKLNGIVNSYMYDSDDNDEVFQYTLFAMETKCENISNKKRKKQKNDQQGSYLQYSLFSDDNKNTVILNHGGTSKSRFIKY